MGEISAKDAEFLVSVFKHMTSKPIVDWAAVTEDMGLKNVKVTQTRYGQVKKKLEAAAASPNVGKKRARSPAPEDDVDAEQTPPSKRQKKAPVEPTIIITEATPTKPGSSSKKATDIKEESKDEMDVEATTELEFPLIDDEMDEY